MHFVIKQQQQHLFLPGLPGFPAKKASLGSFSALSRRLKTENRQRKVKTQII
jgi:hypothetical protein